MLNKLKKFGMNTLLMFFVLFFVFSGGQAEAITAIGRVGPVRNMGGKFLKIGANENLPSHALFMPKWDGSGTTKLIVGPGNKWSPDLEWKGSENRGKMFANFNTHHTQNSNGSGKGVVYAQYTNVGFYKGESLDLKITIQDYNRFDRYDKPGTNGGQILFQRDAIAISMRGFSGVVMDWTFVGSKSQKFVPTGGYFTFYDIDLNQNIGFHNTWVNGAREGGIGPLYVDNIDGGKNLKYGTFSPYHRFSDSSGTDYKPDSAYVPSQAISVVYNMVRSDDYLRIRWGADSPTGYLSVSADGDYLTYKDNKPARTPVPAPEKFRDIPTLGPKDWNKRVYYQITHDVPFETSTYWYDNYSITDTIDKVWDFATLEEDNIHNFNVTRNNGSNANSWFKPVLSKDGRTVTWTATDAALKNPAFYGSQFTFHIRVKVNKDRLEKEFATRPNLKFYNAGNTATLKVHNKSFNDTLNTNRVETHIYPDGEEPDCKPGTGDPNCDGGGGGDKPTDPDKPDPPPWDGCGPDPNCEPDPETGETCEPEYYTLTIEHYDQDTGRIITSESREIIQGGFYSEYPKSGLKRSDGYNYKTFAPFHLEGEMCGDETIRFNYRVPIMTVNNKGIDIYTNESTQPQPHTVYADKDLGSYSEDEDFKGGKVELSVKDGSRTVWSKDVLVTELQDKYDGNLANTYLNIGAETNYRYEIKLITNGDNNYELVLGDKTTDTEGYKSKELLLKSRSGGSVTFKDVVLTEAKPPKRISKSYETITVSSIRQPRVKSGYGYDFGEPNVNYSTERNTKSRVPDQNNDSKPRFVINSKIVDSTNDYMNSHKTRRFDWKSGSHYKNYSEDRIWYDMKIMSSNGGADNGGDRNANYAFEFGYLNRDLDKSNIGYSSSGTNMAKAGRKQYVPKWILELSKPAGPENYYADFNNTVPVGVHKINFNMENEVNVFAFMLSHEDTKTPTGRPLRDRDEILIYPMPQNDRHFNKFR